MHVQSAAEAGEGVKLACLHVCNRKGEGWEFRDAALMDATRFVAAHTSAGGGPVVCAHGFVSASQAIASAPGHW